jgi:hypothetical protein
MKFRKKERETGVQLLDIRDSVYGAESEAGVADLGGSPVAGNEGAMSTGLAAGGGGSTKKHDRKRLLLIGISAAILAVLFVASSFALGYFIGHDNGVTDTVARAARRSQVGSAGLKRGLTQALGGSAAQRVREMIRSGNAELVGGVVTSVEGGKVMLQTNGGSAAIALTDKTRYLGPGSQVKTPKAPGEANQLEKGQRVTALVKRDPGGGLEALAVRVRGKGARL